ncbi:ABC transporter permease subunit [Paralcaligenes sp. KSB-10]|uniref:ABC transporter permease subunit n=1 Tax=Paralcaligenes sp. KSB-10 TaxID=2901142 RepID=UPI001E3D3946|nr:ABC transporter permease subunit [Paralcaligenes sp. KSB-10]UHL65335.1 ABC transporter permease subunit [Paralcaligenes sp. KSB-10]
MFEMDWSSIVQSRALLFTGMWITLKITAVAICCGLVWGTVLAMFSIARNRLLNVFAQSYVSLFRSIPLVMLLLWFFLIVPQFLKAIFDLSPSVDIRLVSAMVAFSLLEAAFFCEIMRAGIQSLPKGQFHAARALGMNPLQSMRFIILPQAFKAMLPIVLTQCIVIFQDTSLVYVIALGDFFRRATSIGERDGTIVQMLLFAGVVYWIICSLLTLVVKLIQLRAAHD